MEPLMQPAAVNYDCPYLLLVRRDVQNRKLGQIERAVTKWGGVFSQAMAIGKTGYASEFFEAHPNWFLLKVTENALPNAHQYHREWIENYFNGPDWQAEVGIAI